MILRPPGISAGFSLGTRMNTLSAKAGAAGKDLGKPGKNFSKIADKAAAEYGSKAEGERVAGAVLAKMRAKRGGARHVAHVLSR